MNKNWRWLPAGIVPVVIVAATVSGSAVAEAQPQLPARTAQELLEFVAASSDAAYSGTVEQTSELGLPDIGMATPPGSRTGDDPTSTALELLTTDHTARIFVDGPDNARIQVLDELAQRDVILNQENAWTYDSAANEATHAALPDKESTRERVEAKVQEKASEYPELQDIPRTPAQLAELFLAKIDPSTEVSVGDDHRVAGRSAYELRMEPTDPATLIGSIAVAIDSETGVPMGVTVQAKGQDAPAFEAQFTSVDFTAPDASLFDFTPPPGATVIEAPTQDELEAALDEKRGAENIPTDGAPVEEHEQPEIIGTGWSTIVELPVGSAAKFGLLSDQQTTPGMSDIMDIKPGMDPADVAGAQALLEQALNQVDGGRALQTSLVSVLITDDGRILMGSVSADQLVVASRT